MSVVTINQKSSFPEDEIEHVVPLVTFTSFPTTNALQFVFVPQPAEPKSALMILPKTSLAPTASLNSKNDGELAEPVLFTLISNLYVVEDFKSPVHVLVLFRSILVQTAVPLSSVVEDDS